MMNFPYLFKGELETSEMRAVMLQIGFLGAYRNPTAAITSAF